MNKNFFIIGIILLIFLNGCEIKQEVNIEPVSLEDTKYEGKILYIDSYHEGYEWSDGITKGVQDTLAGTGVELKIHRMDTKRNSGEEFKIQAALDAKAVIEEFIPDVVITSDDNAFKYLVMKYYKNADLPIVYSGLNWDSSLYKTPYSNAAGMVEVSLTNQIIAYLRDHADGTRLGYISADTVTERKNIEYYKKIFDINFEKTYFVKTFEEWKVEFSKLQDEVDIIIFENNAGITDWNVSEAKDFALAESKVPIGTTNPWIMDYSLLGLTKVPEEQGEWSAQTALRILDGEKPDTIPEVTNKKGKLYLNLKIAEKLNIVFRTELLKNSEKIE